MPRRPSISREIDRYVRSGETDPYSAAWPGSVIERECRAHDDLRAALFREVKRRAGARAHPPLPVGDLAAFTRRKVEPMVRGLFPKVEQEPVLITLERSVVFLTAGNIERVVRDEPFHQTAWDLANLYLGSLGVEPLGPRSAKIVGLSAETTCFVSVRYFTEDDPFADFVVHEAAHVFHNCKRRTMGLRETRTREWPLDIEYRKRETFAYSCEAFARVVERAGNARERIELSDEFARAARISDERVDASEVGAIVRRAAAARNGWKVILAACVPAR